jgi:isoamylase
MRIEEGEATRLGARFDGRGVNFALFSEHATAVELCLFDASGRGETARVALPRRSDDVFHGYVPGLLPGQLYGYRVHGPWEPASGHRFNPNKLLIDPYAEALSGRLRWHDALYGHRRGLQREDVLDRRDSAPMMPKCVVAAPDGLGPEAVRLRRALNETVIYEAHAKGLTQRHPGVPQPIRGTYAALGHPAVIEHLVRLGVTAVELLPIQAFVDDRPLVERGLVNYWGYQPIAYFAPEPRYLGEAGIPGLRAAVRELHAAGIEVILDVVYNHTGEGDHLGPTLSFRGIDNASYYKLQDGDRRRNLDVTGCGNTLDAAHPRVMQLMLDSLRHWVTAYGIDGFRFDLASSVARDPLDFSPRAAALQAMGQDPVLGGVKLIAEPWDLGMGGYQTGGFPRGWSDWNDHFRDAARGFWRGDLGTLPKLTQGLTGSREVFEPSGRSPTASVNFVTAHDGFTLNDLVSYASKHNLANGEDGRDGTDNNLSVNHGAEGPTTDATIRAARARHRRNLLATLVLAQGVPMLTAGDEFARTQGGNNNAYCQDNDISWVDWSGRGHAEDPTLPDFLTALIALRRDHRALRRRRFLTGRVDPETGLKDVYWLDPAGREMDDGAWGDGGRRVFGMQLGNDRVPDGVGERVLVLVNGGDAQIDFALDPHVGGPWTLVFDTTLPEGGVEAAAPVAPAGTVALPACCVRVLTAAPA